MKLSKPPPMTSVHEAIAETRSETNKFTTIILDLPSGVKAGDIVFFRVNGCEYYLTYKYEHYQAQLCVKLPVQVDKGTLFNTEGVFENFWRCWSLPGRRYL